MVGSDTESVVGDPPVTEENDDIDDIEARPQRGFNFGDIL